MVKPYTHNLYRFHAPNIKKTKYTSLVIKPEYKEYLALHELNKTESLYWFCSLSNGVDITIKKPYTGEYYKYDIWDVVVRKMFTKIILKEFVVKGSEVNELLGRYFKTSTAL